MQTTLAFKLVRLMGGKWGAPIALMLLVVGFYLFSGDKPAPYVLPSKVQAPPAVQAPDPRDLACGADLDARRKQAKIAYVSKDYDQAYELLDYCIARLQNDSAYHAEFLKYAEAKNKASDAERVAQDKKNKAEKKKQGVTVGMSKQDALDSSWGRPEYVNRTTTAYGVREQWVYGSRGYLYFDDDVLTSIQN